MFPEKRCRETGRPPFADKRIPDFGYLARQIQLRQALLRPEDPARARGITYPGGTRGVSHSRRQECQPGASVRTSRNAAGQLNDRR